MEDFKILRNLMVETQLVPRGIKDKRVLDAMRKVPRHVFVDGSLQYRAYDDMALPIGEGQTISQPYMVAVMTELLGLKGDEKILEIGTGSGYQAAVLAELAKEVFTVERVSVLSENAGERFRSLGYVNIHVMTGDGTLGWPENSPYNGIMITAGTPDIPKPLMEQLADGGIIVAPVGDRFSQQLKTLRKRGKNLVENYYTPCVFVPLIGRYGWVGNEEV